MTSEKFEVLLSQLNKKQREAVETIEGPVMVIAGPGTGKTQILTVRIANILEKTDTAADSILALTFTEAAAANMRSRLVSLIGSRGYYVNISTFHGFCNRLIQDYPEHFDEIIGRKNANEVDRISVIRKIIEDNEFKNLKPFGDNFFHVRDILSAIRDLKNEGLDYQEFEKLIREKKNNFEKNDDLYYEQGAHKGKMKGVYQKQLKQIEKNTELVKIYLSYQEELERRKLYDFEDMILKTIEALEKKEDFLLEIQERYQYLLVDEHQDTNGAQNRVLELLASFYPNPNLFVVGDEKQAIFRFQGASLDNFLYFQKKYPAVKLINLEENYRSPQSILDSAQSLIEKNQATIFTPLKSRASSVGQKIKILNFSQPEAELLFISEKIREKLEAGTPPNEIAILYRENRDVFSIADFLSKKGISYVIESDLNILDDSEIKKLNRLLIAIDDFGNDEKLISALHIDFLNIDPLDIYALIQKSKDDKKSIHRLIAQSKDITGLEKAGTIISAYNNIRDWQEKSKNENFLEFFERVVRESGLLAQLLKNERFQKLEKLGTLFNEIRKIVQNHRDFSLRNYIEYLEILESHGVSITGRSARNTKAIRLMTAHRAKGLEFDFVFIIGASDGHWGNRREFGGFSLPIKTSIDISKIEKNEDERRLFYMAMTRAKKSIHITWSRHSLDGREQVPSQFISEIKEELKEEIIDKEFGEKITESRGFLFNERVNEEPTLKNAEYVKNIFEKRGLSVTALNNYFKCPWRYFYLNLVRIPKVKSKYQIFGTAVHFAFKNFFDEKRKGNNADSKFILEKFRQNLERESLSENEFSEIYKKGESFLPKYFDFYKNIWNYNTINEFKISGVHLVDNIKLVGNLDKLEIQENPAHVIVVDYKTKKPESRNSIEGGTKLGTGDYKRQLVFYKILLDLKPEKTWSMDAGVIDFIEPNERGIFKKEVFEITSAETEELKEIIKKTADEIINLSFWSRRCSDKKCEYCALRNLME